MRTFVIGDIHGNYKGLHQVIELSGIDKNKDQLITLGDIVDGVANQSYEVVEELLKFKNRIDIMGNHDAWFMEWINKNKHPTEWGQGGHNTAISYCSSLGIDSSHEKILVPRIYGRGVRSYKYVFKLIPEMIPESHVKFFKNQIKCHIDDDFNVFVHGGFYRAIHPALNSIQTCTWDRKLWDQALSAKATDTKLSYPGCPEINKVFIGHTPTTNWDTDEPMKASNIWNLDTGGGGDGKVTIMEVATENYWQSDIFTNLYTL